MNQDQQSQLKLLIPKGKEQGFLTYAEVNDHLPDDIVDPEQIEDIIGMINDMGIQVHETAPDSDTLLLSSDAAPADEDAAEEAAAALATVDSEFGRTTDPVRMYMREMGTVELLTREGEIEIAKRIEDGLAQVFSALASYPASSAILLNEYAKVEAGESRLADLFSGFIDPNAIDEPIPTPAQVADRNTDDHTRTQSDRNTCSDLSPIGGRSSRQSHDRRAALRRRHHCRRHRSAASGISHVYTCSSGFRDQDPQPGGYVRNQGSFADGRGRPAFGAGGPRIGSARWHRIPRRQRARSGAVGSLQGPRGRA